MTLSKCKQNLKRNEFFFYHCQEWPGANAIIQTILYVLTHQKHGFVRHLEPNKINLPRRRTTVHHTIGEYYLSYNHFLETQTIDSRLQYGFDVFNTLPMFGQMHHWIVYSKHFDNKHTFLRLGSGHFKEPCAAQAVRGRKTILKLERRSAASTYLVSNCNSV